MTDSYLSDKQKRDIYEEQNNEILFGLITGTMLLLIGFLKILSSEGLEIYAFLAICVTGLCFVLLGLIVPAALKWPCKGFVFVGNKISMAVFILILSFIYVIFVLPIGFFMRNKRNKYGFFKWGESFDSKEKGFEQIRTSKIKNVDSVKKSSFFSNIYGILGTLVQNKRFFLIPVVIVLVLVGSILFFVSSSLITYFVYPAF